MNKQKNYSITIVKSVTMNGNSVTIGNVISFKYKGEYACGTLMDIDEVNEEICVYLDDIEIFKYMNLKYITELKEV